MLSFDSVNHAQVFSGKFKSHICLIFVLVMCHEKTIATLERGFCCGVSIDHIGSPC